MGSQYARGAETQSRLQWTSEEWQQTSVRPPFCQGLWREVRGVEQEIQTDRDRAAIEEEPVWRKIFGDRGLKE